MSTSRGISALRPRCRGLLSPVSSLCLAVTLGLFLPHPGQDDTRVLAQPTQTAPRALTFDSPGRSRVTFSPPSLSPIRVFKVELNFRSLLSNGLLLYQRVLKPAEQSLPKPDPLVPERTGPTAEEARPKAEEEERQALIDGFYMYAELNQGRLAVGHVFDHYKDIITIGKALNDDQWHKLEMTLNQTSGDLTVSLDQDSAMQFLKAYVWGRARRVLDWTKLPTTVQFGGTVESQDFVPFVGCLRDLKYSTDGGAITRDVPLTDMAAVTHGCQDRCQTGADRCKNGARCVNLYTGFHCDCFGTDYEGPACEKAGPTLMTLSGYEWLTYKIYEGEQNRPFTKRNRFALEFKTERSPGILLYAVGGYPYHNHIIASIKAGQLYVSVAFDDAVLDFTMGLGLDDGRWHNLTIEHSGPVITVYLDGNSKSSRDSQQDFYLSLDPLLYIGGGHRFVSTRGLQTTRNFVGCLKNVYFNDQSLLFLLQNDSIKTTYHGGAMATFGCSPLQEIPISFPNAASLLHWRLAARGENLTVEFNFRTVRQDAVLFYLELVSGEFNGGGRDYGFIEVWLKESHPMLAFVPSIRSEQYSENITLPIVVSDQKWHNMHIEFLDSQVRLRVDAVSRSSQQYIRPLSHKEQIILGYGLRRYKRTEGYVGCMEKIIIQGQKLDPIEVVESSAAIGLNLDGCFLVDYCALNNICEHGSKCLSDWSGVECDCLGDNYEGKACHFAKYPPTCDAYYQAGLKESGVRIIDLDGPGPLEATYVECETDTQRDGQLFGATTVANNFGLETQVRGQYLEDRRYDLTYRDMNRMQLMALTAVSAKCEQFFKFSCRSSPIEMGTKTWFRSANGQVVDNFGSTKSGYCTCTPTPDGTCNGKRCYCDHASPELGQDEGYNHNKEQLPIVEMTFLQNRSSPGVANMTLGPLVCWGSDKQHMDNLVTLTTEKSYLKLHTWRSGDLGFHFKTHHDNALLLMQTSNDTVLGNKFILKIITENTVEFFFRINGTVVREKLQTAQPVNQGDWHYILIEQDSYNMRLSLDTTRKLVTLSHSLSGVVDFNGILYVGGLPEDIAASHRERTPGFSGCLRAFLYNNKEVQLSMLVDGSMSGVSSGCMSSCWPNPCQHGGTCKEDWGEYTCHCQDPWAHQGHNCEYNLNTDAVTFSGSASSYLTYDLSKQHNPLDQTVVLSFRTFQSDALLFYAHDHLSNFIQLEIQQSNTIVFTYNTYLSITSGFIKSAAPLNDGEWKQVVVQEYYNLTKLIFQEQSLLMDYHRTKISQFTLDPFKDSIQKETVFVLAAEMPAPFVRLYVGGMVEGSTAIPNLKGCIRGLRFGSYHLNLQEKVLELGNSTELAAACENGCTVDKCLNSGYCEEHWRYGNFICDCSESDFSGIYCEKEASVLLDSESVVEHRFSLPVSAQRSVTEQLMLHFRTRGTKPGDDRDMALIHIKSTQSNDYILARIDPEGNVIIETNQGVGIYRMKVSGNFSNGQLHELLYKREGSNMYLTLDGLKEASIVYPDYDLDQIDTIVIGGMLAGEDDNLEAVANFSGCISNTVFIPETNMGLKIRSLKKLHLDDPEVTVHGPKVRSCTADMLKGVLVTDPPLIVPVTTQSFEVLTMPLWNVGSASVVTLSPPLIRTPSPTIPITTYHTPVTTYAKSMMSNMTESSVDDTIVVIAVSVVAGILVFTLIIILLLFRKRRRRYDMKKDPDIELKQPLNHNYHAINSVQASPVPKDHLARLDEFSMITAILGPRAEEDNYAKENNVTNHVDNHVESNSNRHSLGTAPKAQLEDTVLYEHPIFNKRKQRPASSISEVLEELERRQNQKNNGGSIENIVGRPHGEGELEWDPQVDRTPLTYEDITFFNTPLLAPIPDENEGSHVSSMSERNCELKEKPGDSSPSGDESHDNQKSLLDGNADSGYEAESRPEITEEDVTPTGDDEDFDDMTAKAKLYMYNISSVDIEDSPTLSSSSRQLIKRKSNTDT